jgi:TRAP transporter 4TM/12TM fusion protein
MLEMAVGFILIVLAMETCRRTIGPGLTIVALLFLIYAYFGYLAPGVFYHPPVTFMRFVDEMSFSTDALFGLPTQVGATYVYMFVLFGVFFSAAKGGEFFYNISASLTGKTKGGPAKVALFSSALYGTISGSPVSDVMTTGAFTIPMMRQLGYSRIFAGAVEAAASTGGAVLPPVMGTAAFLMAEMTGIKYVDIIVAAILVALLYYFSIFTQVHLRACRRDLKGITDAVPAWQALRSGWQYIAPFFVLIYLLLIGYTAAFAACIAAGFCVVVSYFHKRTRIGFRDLINSMVLVAQRIAPLGAAVAAAGLVLGGIVLSGLAGKIMSFLFAIGSDWSLWALLCTAVLTIVLGMGMPVPAAFVLSAVLCGPALKELGFDAMSAYMFIFYFSCLSAITPPVCVAAFAAATIAEDNPIKIGIQACRLGLVLFIIPFFFVYDSSYLLQGSVLSILRAAAIGVVATFTLGCASEGWVGRDLKFWERSALAVAGIILIVPSWITDIIGIAAATVILVPKLGLLRQMGKVVIPSMAESE